MSAVEVSPWPWLVVNALTCVVIVACMWIDVRRELRSWK